jgi:hypothetical protein
VSNYLSLINDKHNASKFRAISGREYSVSIFNNIPDYWDIKDQSDFVERLVPQLGAIIFKNGLHKVFRISLLHSHFKLNTNEKLVRTYTTQFYSIAVGGSETVPYMWHLAVKNDQFEWWPLEYCDATPSVRQRFRSHKVHAQRRLPFFDQLSLGIVALGLANKVALTALFQRDEFDLANGQTLFKETHDRRRVITPRIANEQPSADDGSIRTLWSFTPRQSVMDAASCATHCYGHCYGHGDQPKVSFTATEENQNGRVNRSRSSL